MKKLSDVEIYKLFKPELSPKKMLELGVFGGSQFGNNIKEYPKNWFLSKKRFVGRFQKVEMKFDFFDDFFEGSKIRGINLVKYLAFGSKYLTY